MLRLVLALTLVLAAAAVGFWFGKQDGTPQQATRARTGPQQSGTRRPEMPPAPPIAGSDTKPPVPVPHPAEQLPPPPGEDTAVAAPLIGRNLALPVGNLKASDLHDMFYESRGGGERRHEATDIMAPRGTPVYAMDDGVIEKMFDSKPGGLTIYLFDTVRRYCFYYAHLDRYADGLHEGLVVKRGTLIGYVGSTGNADVNAPHLHLAIMQLGPEKKWWEGNTPINPYPVLAALAKR